MGPQGQLLPKLPLRLRVLGPASFPTKLSTLVQQMVWLIPPPALSLLRGLLSATLRAFFPRTAGPATVWSLQAPALCRKTSCTTLGQRREPMGLKLLSSHSGTLSRRLRLLWCVLLRCPLLR